MKPRIKINDEALYYSIMLAKKGFYGGDPKNVLNADLSMVLSILEYENFENTYEKSFVEMNKNGR